MFRALDLLPPSVRLRALLGTSEVITDLVVPVDPDRDHIRGPMDAPVIVVEYGDFECPYCGQAEPAVRELLEDSGEVRYVWRHLPLSDVHQHAQLAAEATEAAAKQDKFWEMHDKLFERQDALTGRDLIRYAGELGLEIDRFVSDLRKRAGRGPGRRGRRLRGPCERRGHAYVLHQRHPALRRLRHRHAEGGGQERAGAHQDQCVRKCGPGGGGCEGLNRPRADAAQLYVDGNFNDELAGGLVPPAAVYDSPLGTGFAFTAVSPPATRYE